MMLGTDTPEGYLPENDGADILSAVKPLLESSTLAVIRI